MFSAKIFRLHPRVEAVEDRTLLATFVVTSTSDNGPGSLRQAILSSNAAVSTANIIEFDIPGDGVQTIAPVGALPAITNPVLIDGDSQPGFSGTPLIELSGSQAGAADGLTITGSGVDVRGLAINGFRYNAGIQLTGTGATGNWIYGNFLGTDPTGTQAEPNFEGVEIDYGASTNLIGTNGDGINDAAERNVISGNSFAGIVITGQGTEGNVAAGNFIGTTVNGEVALDNGTAPFYYDFGAAYARIGGGVVIESSATGNTIGTDGIGIDDVDERNIIAGSENDGIDIVGAATDSNIVAGNFIGTDVSGTQALGISGNGVLLAAGAAFNWIGVSSSADNIRGDLGNLISGTLDAGVQVDDNANENVVAGNKIGTDLTGTVALGNSRDGVSIYASSDNTIGGVIPGSANVISGNGYFDGYPEGSGVELQAASQNLVEGNLVGTDVAGTHAVGNGENGVELDSGSTDNTIGGTAQGASNLISANGKYGILLTGQGTSGNEIVGNTMGTDKSITGTLPNMAGEALVEEAP